MQGIARIDANHLSEILDLVQYWSARTKITKRELQSLLGKLNFVCSVCRPGPTFLSRMLALLSKARHPHPHLGLSKDFKKALQWWKTFLSTWNGKSFFFDDHWRSNDLLDPYTNVSKLAFGAYFQGAWLYSTFKEHGIPTRRSIAFKELFAIITALTAWAPRLTGRRMLFHCDNAAVTFILQNGRSRCPHIMTLARYAFFLCAHHSIEISAIHLPGVQKIVLMLFHVYRSAAFVPCPQEPTNSQPQCQRSPCLPSDEGQLLFPARLSHFDSTNLQCSTTPVLGFLQSAPSASIARHTIHTANVLSSPGTAPETSIYSGLHGCRSSSLHRSRFQQPLEGYFAAQTNV